MMEILFYVLMILCYLDFYHQQLKKHLERKIKRLQPPEKLEPQKSITFELSDEDFNLLGGAGFPVIVLKRRKNRIDWDCELKKL